MVGNNPQVPNNIEDTTVLKRFLTDLVLNLNSNPFFSSVNNANKALDNPDTAGSNNAAEFLDIAGRLDKLRNDIRQYVEQQIETTILKSEDDVSVIAQQLGTFTDQALAASWYGLNVKAGGAVAGLEVGSLDPDVTTPGDEASYFRVVANNFVLGRAYESLTQEEKDYLTANGLPNFGTVYTEDKTPLPALMVTWDNINQVYKHYFNGIVQFNNIAGADYANAINGGTTTIDGGKITTNSITTEQIEMNTGWAGVIYNQGGTSTSYKMKIDFTNGEIHIK